MNKITETNRPKPEVYTRVKVIRTREINQSMSDVFQGDLETDSHKEAKFNKVVFGHSFKDFDIDQLFTYYFALKMSVIPLDAPVIFTNDVNQPTTDNISPFNNPETLTIEGFGHVSSDTNDTVKEKRRNGNIANGLHGEPAASEFKHEFGSAYLKGLLPIDKQKLKAFDKWLKAHEQGKKELLGDIKPIEKKDIELITPIFYGLKARYLEENPENQNMLLLEVITLMEKIFNQTSAEELKEEYAIELSSGQESINRTEANRKLKLIEHLHNPDTLKQVKTFTGTTVTYFDVRGIGSDKGAIELANTKGKSDILLLIDDQTDPANNNVTIGTQYKIYHQNNNDDTLLENLADRMQTAESQYGKGYPYSQESSFGSHKNIVASPQSEGSDIEPQQMWRALQHFLDYPRYSLEDFQEKTETIAKKLGTDKYIILPVAPSNTGYQFGARKAIFTLESTDKIAGGQITVDLTENDLPFYEQLFSDDQEKNRQLLFDKTTVSEAPEIIEIKQLYFTKWTKEYLESDNAERILELLDSVNENTIVSLPTEDKLSILLLLSTNETVVSNIWNKDDLTFSLIDARLPEEILPIMEEYKLNRYKLKSLASSIDSTLINHTISEVISSKNKDQQLQLSTILLSILTSETYKSTHQELSYDSLLQSIIFYASELKFSNSDLASDIVSQLSDNYGKEMASHWQSVDSSYRDLLINNFGDQAETLTSLIPEIDNAESIPGLAHSKVLHPNTEKINARIESDTSNQTVTFLVEVTRPIAAKVMRREFPNTNGDMTTLDNIDAHITTGAFNIEKADHMKVVKVLIPMITQSVKEILLKHPDSKLRIIQGGFINLLSAQAQDHISDAIADLFDDVYPDDTKKEARQRVKEFKQNRLMWSTHNRNTDSYNDSPFLQKI